MTPRPSRAPTRLPAVIRLVAFLALAAVSAAAQPREPAAETRFHDGARLFAEGDVEAAARAVDAGLAEAPADARLRALRELLRQEQESDGGGGPQPDEPQSGDDPSEPPPGDGQGDADAPPNPGESPDPTQPPDEGGSAPDDGASQTPPPADGAGGQPGDARAPMSRAEAEALLDAVGGDERLLLRRQRLRSGGAVRPERDW